MHIWIVFKGKSQVLSCCILLLFKDSSFLTVHHLLPPHSFRRFVANYRHRQTSKKTKVAKIGVFFPWESVHFPFFRRHKVFLTAGLRDYLIIGTLQFLKKNHNSIFLFKTVSFISGLKGIFVCVYTCNMHAHLCMNSFCICIEIREKNNSHFHFIDVSQKVAKNKKQCWLQYEMFNHKLPHHRNWHTIDTPEIFITLRCAITELDSLALELGKLRSC